MMPTISSNQATSGPTGQTPPRSTSSAATPTVDKNMFLQLLVAQLRNQDPMNPSDGTQFVAQLAQFQQLEQSVNTGQDITAIRQDLDKLAAPVTSGTVTQS
jgi:flagellar basal-body rod modification protein FlgD